MSIRNAGKTIKEARLKAGMTQEQLSEGICTVLSLSRIENGSSGVSPVTFQSLMAHAGAPCELYPIFASRTDFDCFYALKRARYFLNSWQLQECYDELAAIESKSFADNKLYYQEWLYLYGSLLIRSGCHEHSDIYAIFLEAIHTTRPEIDFADFRQLFLSTTEIELLIAIAQEFLYLNDSDTCYIICSQIASYLASAELDYLKKDFLEAEYAISYSKYLLYIKDYEKVLSIADVYRHKMVQDSEDAPLLELTFLTALGYYYTGKKDAAYTYFKNTFYSAHAIESYYATICRNYVIEHNLFVLDNYLSKMEDISRINFPTKKVIDTSNLTDGTYDFFSPDILTIGRLIHDLRKEQCISQTILCQGLCSKSKLSKIENDLLQPDIFLAEALLQRLGISERVLTFWGNERESEIFQLHFKLMHCRLLTNEQKMDYMNRFRNLISEKKPNLLQSYIIDTCSLLNSPTEIIDRLQTGLYYSLPQFDIRLIHNYRLTWSELSLLNNIAYNYRSIDNEKCILYFSKLFDYLYINSLDILLVKNVFTLTYFMYSHSLYVQGRYFEVTRLLNDDSYKILKGNSATFSYFLFYYCQSLAECKQLVTATKYAHYTCSIQELYELTINSNALKNYLQDDFGICII
ncbi:MAG: transcriptional regulator [Lachnobacterium sp.]|nr:transcriptional regulator [Lachnobacterium sp.]